MVDGTDLARAFAGSARAAERVAASGGSDSAMTATNGPHQGLPVAGYQPQSSVNVALVNEHKAMEERLLRHLDQIASTRDLDPRWYSIARTGFEQAFMALNRSVFRPGRVVLPDDNAPRVPRHDPEAAPATALGGRPHP